MKIVILDSDNVVSIIHENVSNIEIEPNGLNATFSVDGSFCSFQGVKNFIVLDDHVPITIGETVSQEIINLNRKKEFVKMNVPEKIGIIEDQQLQQDLALADIFEHIQSGGGSL